jgi:hypothetical protein
VEAVEVAEVADPPRAAHPARLVHPAEHLVPLARELRALPAQAQPERPARQALRVQQRQIVPVPQRAAQQVRQLREPRALRGRTLGKAIREPARQAPM